MWSQAIEGRGIMTEATRACKLDIFLDLEADELDELVGLSTRITAPQGRILYMPDETGEVLFFVQEGTVQIYRIGKDGSKLKQLTSGDSPSRKPVWVGVEPE